MCLYKFKVKFEGGGNKNQTEKIPHNSWVRKDHLETLKLCFRTLNVFIQMKQTCNPIVHAAFNLCFVLYVLLLSFLYFESPKKRFFKARRKDRRSVSNIMCYVWIILHQDIKLLFFINVVEAPWERNFP